MVVAVVVVVVVVVITCVLVSQRLCLLSVKRFSSFSGLFIVKYVFKSYIVVYFVSSTWIFKSIDVPQRPECISSSSSSLFHIHTNLRWGQIYLESI